MDDFVDAWSDGEHARPEEKLSLEETYELIRKRIAELEEWEKHMGVDVEAVGVRVSFWPPPGMDRWGEEKKLASELIALRERLDVLEELDDLPHPDDLKGLAEFRDD